MSLLRQPRRGKLGAAWKTLPPLWYPLLNMSKVGYCPFQLHLELLTTVLVEALDNRRNESVKGEERLTEKLRILSSSA
jgi:hypothetical protein